MRSIQEKNRFGLLIAHVLSSLLFIKCVVYKQIQIQNEKKKKTKKENKRHQITRNIDSFKILKTKSIST